MRLVLDLQNTSVEELSTFVALLKLAKVEGPDGLMLSTPPQLGAGTVSLSFNVPTWLLDEAAVRF